MRTAVTAAAIRRCCRHDSRFQSSSSHLPFSQQHRAKLRKRPAARPLSAAATAGTTGRDHENPFRGVWPIVATPFREDDESIDLAGFERAIDFFAREVGVGGCTVVGVLGESNRLTDGEREELVRIATSAGCRICVGTSHPGTAATIRLSETAMELGAHSVMITPSKEPSGPDQSTVLEYYSRIYHALGDDVPVVLQDHPASTGVHMSTQTLRAIISEKCPSARCIKLESLPTPPKIRLLKPWIRENDLDVTILTGLGALYGAFDLDAGSDGFMTGFAFPEILQALVESEDPWQLYQRFLPLLVFEQQPGVSVRKEIYKLRGLFDSTRVRHPGKGIGENDKTGVLRQLEDCIESVFDDKNQGNNIDLTRKIDLSKFFLK